MYDSSIKDVKSPEEKTRLTIWQQRRARADSDYSEENKRMDERETLYKGKRKIKPLVKGDHQKDGTLNETPHINNLVFENVESMVSTSIPTPKVTAKRKKDEKLAAVIEHWLRNELDRLPFETMNDMAERTVPLQGGCGWLVEWDNKRGTHTHMGELKVTMLHPKLFCPQPGVFTGIQDMDWFIVKVPTTKGSIRREYGLDVSELGEEQPELRSSGGTASQDEMVTKYIGYEKNEDGGIDRFVWVNSTVLENIENYQARHQEVCRGCHRKKPTPGQIISNNVETPPLIPRPGMETPGGLIPEDLLSLEGAFGVAGELADRLMKPPEDAAGKDMLLAGIEVDAGKPKEPVRYQGGPCPWCGGTDWTDAEDEYEEVMLPIRTGQGTEVQGASYSLDANGKPILKPQLIPYYKPNMLPIVLQRNVSVYGQLLGNADSDAIEDQQNTTNRLEKKVIDRLIKAGTRITLPPNNRVTIDPNDGEKIYLSDISDRQYIGTYDFSGSVESELSYMTMIYEEARRQLGITNSFQGREDRTATSGIAKEFQAAQSAGRLESKRVMKGAAYAELFEMMFKFALAYSDEPRDVTARDHRGDQVYETFNRYDFLEQDADGVYYWNDDFLFSVDTNQALEANRTAMWQETRMNLQTGAFGDPAQTETLILFWSKMEELHYPGAGSTRKFLEEKLQAERDAAQAQQQPMPTPPAGMPGMTEAPPAPTGGMPPEVPSGDLTQLPTRKVGSGQAVDQAETGSSL